jgi:hypothetical protein
LGFGSKEGVEDPRHQFWRHSAPAVGDLEKYIFARGQAIPHSALRKEHGVGVESRGLHDDTPGVALQRLGRIEEQTHDDLSQLTGIRANQRQVIREIDHQVRTLSHIPLERFDGGACQPI